MKMAGGPRLVRRRAQYAARRGPVRKRIFPVTFSLQQCQTMSTGRVSPPHVHIVIIRESTSFA